jgi:hypothetical protein
MPTLLELQRRMLQAILDIDGPAGSGGGANGRSAAALLRGDRAAAGRRLEIYANSARANFLGGLRLCFPAVRRLVGEDFFDQCGLDYRSMQPSRSGDLQHVGAGFAGHLARLHAGGDYAYLAEVARFEWLYQEALLAADHEPLGFARLASIDPAAAAGLRFRLHPSVRLFSSRFPVLEIWEANVPGAAEPPLIDLDKGADRLILARTRRRVAFQRLSPGEYAFLTRLADADTLGAAIAAGAAAATGDDEEFDATATLRRLVLAETIVEVSPG